MHRDNPRNVLGSIPPEEVPGPQTQEEREEAVYAIGGILDEALLLFERKNKEYGNAIDHTGVVGAVIALTGDVSRLRTMVLKDEAIGLANPDNVRDKLIDVLVQAAIGIYELDKENWAGID